MRRPLHVLQGAPLPGRRPSPSPPANERSCRPGM